MPFQHIPSDLLSHLLFPSLSIKRRNATHIRRLSPLTALIAESSLWIVFGNGVPAVLAPRVPELRALLRWTRRRLPPLPPASLYGLCRPRALAGTHQTSGLSIRGCSGSSTVSTTASTRGKEGNPYGFILPIHGSIAQQETFIRRIGEDGPSGSGAVDAVRDEGWDRQVCRDM